MRISFSFGKASDALDSALCIICDAHSAVDYNELLNAAASAAALLLQCCLLRLQACKPSEAPLNISVLYFRLQACKLSSASAEQRLSVVRDAISSIQ
jgi:hypothetical protein